VKFDALLSSLVERGASDIHLHSDFPPVVRVSGGLEPVGVTRLPAAAMESLVEQLCDDRQRSQFEQDNQVDLAYSLPGVARFRVNLFRQQGKVSAVLRVINSGDEQLKVVDLPESILADFRDREQGLILVTGPTGSGKSTTLARVIDEINRTHSKMIITVEDPVEFIHRPKRSLIVQREVGRDVSSFASALVGAMRQDPNVIMIGEIRDYETANAMISAAQTGHLVLSTLHTMDTVRTVNRVLELFPQDEREVARQLFADSLVGIVSQRLLPRRGGGMVAAMEIMRGTLRIKDLIKDTERGGELYDAIKDGSLDGMRLFDDHLAQLYADGLIDAEVGLSAATSQQAFRMATRQIDLQRQQTQQTEADSRS